MTGSLSFERFAGGTAPVGFAFNPVLSARLGLVPWDARRLRAQPQPA